MSDVTEHKKISTEVLPGTLYIVPTPIGHLGDLSPRARDVLESVDLIAAEDTRHARHLFQVAGLSPRARLQSYHDHNARQRAAGLIAQLRQRDLSLALISDAGTPGCSDPGFRLVRAAIAQGVRVVPLPGPAAFLCALVASGLPTDRFLFVGFLPQSGGKRRAALKALRDEPATLCLYTSPHRVIDVLSDLRDTFGDRQACVARELTKRHEELLHGDLNSLIDTLSARDAVRGEIALIVEGHQRAEDDADLGEARRLIATLQAHDLPPRTIKRVVAAHLGMRPKAVYKLMLGDDDPS